MIGSIQRRYFTDKFRNFVDLCVQRSFEERPSASQLLTHVYLKKMKLSSVVSTLQMSVMSEGLIEVQKKIAQETSSSNSRLDSPTTINNDKSAAPDSGNQVMWEF